jgi:hypothetical protein
MGQINLVQEAIPFIKEKGALSENPTDGPF